MKVKILVEFEVPDAEGEGMARDAASRAAWNFLALHDGVQEVSEVTVHLEGYYHHGHDCVVRLGEEHE